MTQKTFQMTPVVRAFAVGLLALSQMGVALGADQRPFTEWDIVANGFGLAEALKAANVTAEQAAQVAFNYIVTVHHEDILSDRMPIIDKVQYVKSELPTTRTEFNDEQFAERETEAKKLLQKRLDALKWCVEHVTDLDPDVQRLLKEKIAQVESDKDHLTNLCLDCRFGSSSLPKNFYTPSNKYFHIVGSDNKTHQFGYHVVKQSYMDGNPQALATLPPTPEDLKANIDKLVPYTRNGSDLTDALLKKLREIWMRNPDADTNNPDSFIDECGEDIDESCKPEYDKRLASLSSHKAERVTVDLLVGAKDTGGGGDTTGGGGVVPPAGGGVDAGGGGAGTGGDGGAGTGTPGDGGGAGTGDGGTPPGPVPTVPDVLYSDVKTAIDAAKTALKASPEDAAKQAKLQEEMDKLPTAKVKGVDLARIEGVVDANTEALTRHETILNNHGDLIEKNKSDLTAHEVTLTGHGVAIEANRVAIETVKRDLETQKGEIDAQAGAINTNREGIADNGRAIERNRGQIAENLDKITTNTNRLTTQGEALSTVEGRIAGHTTRIETNAELIRGLSLKDVQLSDGIRALNDRITDVDDEFKKGAAMNIALTGLFQPYNVEKHNIAVSLGGYKSALAIALGTGYRYNDKVAVRVGASTALKHGNGFAFNVALDYRFGD